MKNSAAPVLKGLLAEAYSWVGNGSNQVLRLSLRLSMRCVGCRVSQLVEILYDQEVVTHFIA